jgi:hypothetical protein
MEGCEDMQFALFEFLSGKNPSIDIHCSVQAVYGFKCVDVSTVKMLGMAV